MVTEPYMIRRGEAISHVRPVTIADTRSAPGLTERGHQQAALLEQRLRAEPWGRLRPKDGGAVCHGGVLEAPFDLVRIERLRPASGVRLPQHEGHAPAAAARAEG